MKICLAQYASVIGDLEKNLDKHTSVIFEARRHQTDLIVFPELSLTGYIPEKAGELAKEEDDERLEILQDLATKHETSIAVGLPIKTNSKPQIGMLIFQPQKERKLYAKQYLHEDELPFFSQGKNYHGPVAGREDLALSICYELSVEAHAEAACNRGASIYLASAVKTVAGVEKAHQRLAQIATEQDMITMMVNCVGECEGQPAGGKSAIWQGGSEPLKTLGSSEEALLIIDTESLTVTESRLS